MAGFAALLAMMVLAPSMARAATYYVSTTGSDSYAGSSTSPWRNICYAVRRVSAGDTLIVKGGDYYEDCRSGTGSIDLPDGTSTSRITLRNATGERVVLHGLVWLTDADYWTFDGINVTWDSTVGTSGTHMVKLTDGTGWEWKNSEIWGAMSYANMLVASSAAGLPSQWKLEGNCFHTTYPSNSTNQDHNLYVNGNSQNGSGIITRNIFYGAPNGENVKLAGGSSPQGTQNIQLTYNTLDDASQNILTGWASTGNLFKRNIITRANNAMPIRAYQLTGANNKAEENFWYDGTNTDFVLEDSGYQTLSLLANVNADPRFDVTNSCSGYKPQNTNAQPYGRWAGTGGGTNPGLVAFVGSTAAEVQSTSITLPRPANTQQGHVMIAQLVSRSVNTVSAPPGWTCPSSADHSISGARMVLCWKVAGASEPASYSFSTSDSNGKAGGIETWSGVSAANPFAATSEASGTGTACTATGVTTTVGSQPLSLFCGHVGAVTYTAASGWTERRDLASSTATYKATAFSATGLGPSTAGGTGNPAATASSSGGGWISMLVALQPGS
jgi:hypothetical protein